MTDLPGTPANDTDREALPGTVKFYERHIFICTGQTAWPARIQSGGGFPETLWNAITERVEEMSRRVKMTACNELSTDGGFDLLVFPDMVRYRAVQEGDVPALVEDHLIGDEVSDRIPHEPLEGHHVFVCVHANRDKRCGVAGPTLIMRFRRELTRRGIDGDVHVRATSHVGGHRFAGNVLIYPGGNWYGYVTPEDVPHIVDRHIRDDDIVEELWRGRMGMTHDEQLTRVKELYDRTT